MLKQSILVASLAITCVVAMNRPAYPADRGALIYNDHLLVNFEADPNDVCEVVSHKGLFTDFQLGPDEVIQEAYLSDKRPKFWRSVVNDSHQHFLVKPLQAGLINTALIITNKRTYQIRFLPTVEAGRWNQRVTWSNGDDAAFTAPKSGKVNPAKAALESSVGTIKLANINADYAINGSASIRPTSVIDDGKRTKITFPANLQEMPMILVKSADGKLSIARWTVASEDNGARSMTLAQLITGAVLKLGEAKVEITNNHFPAPQNRQ